MRTLSDEERAAVDRRKQEFDHFLNERMPVLTDFMKRLGLPNAPLVLVEAKKFVPALDQWMRSQAVASEDRTWILTRLGYFIGEYLVQRHRGCWFVNEIPDSRFFARYVVGNFANVAKPNAMVDPFAVADAYLSVPPGRSLTSMLNTVEQELAGQNAL
jgi:hypothetical protein